MTILHAAPKFASNEGVLEALTRALGSSVLASTELYGEVILTVARDSIEDALRTLRDDHQYQQLMEIAGVDYPDRPERFEVVYMLLSLTKNHRVMVKVNASESTPVPSVTPLWPVAGWLEREVFDMYGVLFAGNTDLRRILTDYGFEGHPQRKDFPLTGYQELRYSEEDGRVVYEPVKLAQDLRQFDFMSPWEGADYVLPGDEKADTIPPAPAPVATKPETSGTPKADVPKTTPSPAATGGGAPASAAAPKRVASAKGAPVTTAIPEPGAPDPTESRPARKPRAKKSEGGLP
ncbi:MAG: NADH-quinone oxidoreductase subunit C [Novosphingobium sp.]